VEFSSSRIRDRVVSTASKEIKGKDSKVAVAYFKMGVVF
jgi:hypothetical protein